MALNQPIESRYKEGESQKESGTVGTDKEGFKTPSGPNQPIKRGYICHRS